MTFLNWRKVESKDCFQDNDQRRVTGASPTYQVPKQSAVQVLQAVIRTFKELQGERYCGIFFVKIPKDFFFISLFFIFIIYCCSYQQQDLVAEIFQHQRVFIFREKFKYKDIVRKMIRLKNKQSERNKKPMFAFLRSPKYYEYLQ